jgi:hypothetical protein
MLHFARYRLAAIRRAGSHGAVVNKRKVVDIPKVGA